jgi:hypothetical protein
MAHLIGRLKSDCPCCGFGSVHVKQNEGKLPFLHCPDCGFVAATKSLKQAEGLLANTRRESTEQPRPPQADRPIEPRQAEPMGKPEPAAAAPAISMGGSMGNKPPAKPAGLWDSLMRKGAQ